jgi:hypothetical protein
MRATPQYGEIRRDYDEKSRRFFSKSYRPPQELSFAESPALFPDADLREQLAAEYDTQCSLLLARSHPLPRQDRRCERVHATEKGIKRGVLPLRLMDSKYNEIE